MFKFLKAKAWSLVLIWLCNLSSFSQRMAVSEKMAYLASGSEGVVVLDISNQAKPNRVAHYTSLHASAIAIRDLHAYLADETFGLRVLNISDTANIHQIGSCSLPGNPNSIVVSGKSVFITCGEAGLVVVNVNDPANPALIGTLETPGSASSAALVGPIVFVADGIGGLQIVDAAAPALPRWVGSYDASTVEDVQVTGNYAFLASGEDGLDILSITNRSAPTRVSVTKTAARAIGVQVSGNKIVVTTDAGLEVFDVSNKVNPRLEGRGALGGLTDAGTIMFSRPADTSATDLILDCDPGNDVDDIGDLAVMHALADQGEINILAEMYSMRPGFGAPNIEVINRFYGRPEIPIGVSKTSYWDAADWYGSFLQTNYYHSIGHSTNAPDAVRLYRQILAQRPDRSVTILVSGQLRNIYDLWKTTPDELSELSGPNLLEQKLKRLIVVAGYYPVGREFNLFVDPVAATVLNSITNSLPVTFVGIELGNRFTIGANILSKPDSDPVRAAYDLFYKGWGVQSRYAWASIGLLFAARGYGSTEMPLFTSTKGYVTVNGEDGSNSWTSAFRANQEYLFFAQPIQFYDTELDHLLMQSPMSSGTLLSFVPDSAGGAQVFDITAPPSVDRIGSYNPGLPFLEIKSQDGTNLLRWSAHFSGYVVQFKDRLSEDWVDGGSEQLSPDAKFFLMSLPTTNGTRFYRLRKS